MFSGLRKWRYGSKRLDGRELEKLVLEKGVLIRALPPRDHKSSVKVMENILHLLWGYPSTYSFEIWRSKEGIQFHFYSSRSDSGEQLLRQLHSAYPGVEVDRSGSPLPEVEEDSYINSGFLEFQGRQFYLKGMDDFNYDPLVHVLQALGARGASGMVQVLFKPTEVPSDLKSELFLRSGKAYMMESEIPLFKTLVRIFTFSKDFRDSRRLNEMIARSFTVLNSQVSRLEPITLSYFIPLLRDPYHDLRNAVKRKFPFFSKDFLATIPELLSMVHLPEEMEIGGMEFARESLSPPRIKSVIESENRFNTNFHGGMNVMNQNSGISLGRVFYNGQEREEVRIPTEDLFRHQYIVGATGTGKSTLMIREAVQTFRKGLCTWVIDPYGDLSYDLIGSLNGEEMERVVFLDPLKVEFSLNPFELPRYKNETERNLMLERIIGEETEFMKQMYGAEYWGPSLNRTFQDAIRLLYTKDDAPTFEDILRMIRQEVEGGEEIKAFYREMNKLPPERNDAVINKVAPFVRNRLLNRLFCRKTSTIDFDELVQPGKLVIWRLSRGELSRINSNMIGSTILINLWFKQVMKEEKDRTALILFMDEFHDFGQLETLGTLITQGRKYKTGLVLAHQHTRQLSKKLLNDILGNAATKIFFRVSGEDAELISKGITVDKGDRRKLMESLVTLPDGKAILKMRARFGGRSLDSFEVSMYHPLTKKFNRITPLIERMRELYSAPKLPETSPPGRKFSPRILELLKVLKRIEDENEEPTQTRLSEELSLSGGELSNLIDKAESSGYVRRNIIKEGKGRPKVLTEITEEGRKILGEEIGTGTSTKAGGELHRALLYKAARWLKEQGYYVRIPEQFGRGRQPDMYAYPIIDNHYGKEIAVEAETTANNREQVKKNYEKNIQEGRFVVFVVPNKEVGGKIENILSYVKKPRYRVYVL